MRKMLVLVLAAIMLITCSGCFWGVEGEGYGERDRGEYRGHDRDEHGDRDRGGYGEHEGRY